MEISLQSKRI